MRSILLAALILVGLSSDVSSCSRLPRFSRSREVARFSWRQRRAARVEERTSTTPVRRTFGGRLFNRSTSDAGDCADGTCSR